MRLYNFIWNDFIFWLLELRKADYVGSVDRQYYDRIIYSFEKLMKILHPFMPFITEEIYQRLRAREEGDFVGLGQWPSDRAPETDLFEPMDVIHSLVTHVRDLRNKHQLKQREPLTLYLSIRRCRKCFETSGDEGSFDQDGCSGRGGGLI